MKTVRFALEDVDLWPLYGSDKGAVWGNLAILLEWISADLGWIPAVSSTPPGQLVDALIAGDTDLVFPTTPYWNNPAPLVSKPVVPYSDCVFYIGDSEKSRDACLGYIEGFTLPPTLDMRPMACKRPFHNHQEMMQVLFDGDIDFVFSNSLTVKDSHHRYARNHNIDETDPANQLGISRVQPVMGGHFHFGAADHSADLLAEIDAWLVKNRDRVDNIETIAKDGRADIKIPMV